MNEITRDERGLTLIELLAVLVILGILLAVAVPNLIGFKERSDDSVARSNLREALPAVEAYFADHESYVGMDDAALREIEPALKAIVVGTPTATSYCIRNTVPPAPLYYKHGPAGAITTTACSGG